MLEGELDRELVLDIDELRVAVAECEFDLVPVWVRVDVRVPLRVAVDDRVVVDERVQVRTAVVVAVDDRIGVPCDTAGDDVGVT